jgi:hypothetical protein
MKEAQGAIISGDIPVNDTKLGKFPSFHSFKRKNSPYLDGKMEIF